MITVDEKEQQNVLIKQEDALTHYLQSLLGTGTGTGTGTEKIDSVAANAADVSDKVIEEQKPEAKVMPHVSLETTTKAEREEKPIELVASPRVELDHLPDWAAAEVRCLSAQVDGLKILIPAEFIERIQNVTNRLTPSPKMPVWLYELHDGEDEPVQIINTKKLMLDNTKSRRIDLKARSYVVLIDDGAWGLSCDAIGDVVNLKSEDITWRGESSKRRWLAGTSSLNQAVILDVKKIEQIFIT